VSRTALRIRLTDLGILSDQRTHPQHISRLFRVA
jgi:hypothetical protein